MPVFMTAVGVEWGHDWLSRHPQLLLIDALEDIGEQIENVAELLAPRGKTGALKEESIGRGPVVPLGPTVVRGEMGLKRIPKHGIFVHEGTGLFGHFRRPFTSPNGNLMKFRTDSGRWVSKYSIRGQRPQPFLDRSMELVNASYAPTRVMLLAQQLTRK